MGEVRRSMVPTAAPASARATTREPAPTLAAQPRTVLRGARRGTGLQPPERAPTRRRVRAPAYRKLGLELRPARRRLGEDEPLYQSRDRQHDAHDQNRRRQRRHRGVVRKAHRRRRQTAATSTPATTATSTGARTGRGRNTTTAAGRIPIGSRAVKAQPRGSVDDPPAADRSQHDGSIESRRGRTRRGRHVSSTILKL